MIKNQYQIMLDNLNMLVNMDMVKIMKKDNIILNSQRLEKKKKMNMKKELKENKKNKQKEIEYKKKKKIDKKSY